ncbi:MAG: radical SAM protein [Acidobacteria bacterium]|nr:radical SAM protein [Acidobacteriota bacterium]
MKNNHKDGSGKYHREILVEKPFVYQTVPRHYCRYGMPLDAFREKLEKIPPVDMILVTSLMTYWIEGLKITIDCLKKRFPKAVTVLGGILPSLASAHLYRHGIEADYLIEGYGETKILELAAAHGAKIYIHPDFSNLDTLPYPAVEYLGSQKYLPLLTSRGCPFNCTYCASGVLNEKLRERSPEKVWEEISYMHDRFGVEHLAIFDDALLINKRKRFCRIFQKVKENLRVHFHTPNGLHVGEIDREAAELFFACGFRNLRLSLESTGAEILAKSANKTTVKQMIQAVENLEAAGYPRKDIGVYLLFGYPGQKLAEIEESFRFAADLGVTINLSYFSPVPGTVDFAELQKSGVLSTPMNLYEGTFDAYELI